MATPATAVLCRLQYVRGGGRLTEQSSVWRVSAIFLLRNNVLCHRNTATSSLYFTQENQKSWPCLPTVANPRGERGSGRAAAPLEPMHK